MRLTPRRSLWFFALLVLLHTPAFSQVVSKIPNPSLQISAPSVKYAPSVLIAPLLSNLEVSMPGLSSLESLRAGVPLTAEALQLYSSNIERLSGPVASFSSEPIQVYGKRVKVPNHPVLISLIQAAGQVSGKHPNRKGSASLGSGDALPSGTLFDNSGAQQQSHSLHLNTKVEHSYKLPAGAVGIKVGVARTPEDVDRLVPSDKNGRKLFSGLLESIRKIGPVVVIRYTDVKGNDFVAIDLGHDYDLVDQMPGLYDHERSLIRKMFGYHRNVQMLVPELGKTPDLIVDGVVVELKSVTNGYGSEHLIKSANQQLIDFGERHKVAVGELAIDFEGDTKGASHAQIVSSVMQAIEKLKRDRAEAMRRRDPKIPSPLMIEKIWVYSKEAVSIIIRQKDGIYQSMEVSSVFRGARKRVELF